MTHPIIQAEVDELYGRFGDIITNGQGRQIYPELRQFLSAALHRVAEKVGKEIVGEEKDITSHMNIDTENNYEGFNECRSKALSKLDTIINFKE